jgi:hypothetical protein
MTDISLLKNKLIGDKWTLIYDGRCITPLSYKEALQELDYLSKEVNKGIYYSRVALLIKSVPCYEGEHNYSEYYVTAYKVKLAASFDGYIIKPLDTEGTTDLRWHN